MRPAVDCAPRGERAQWMLLVQVGTQNISPLIWSIESGAFEGAEAMIKDLWADRDCYYYADRERADASSRAVRWPHLTLAPQSRWLLACALSAVQ